MVVVPGQDCPEMDNRGVPDTLPYTTSSLAQGCPVSFTSERHTQVAPTARDSGASRQGGSCLSPCLSTRPCIVLREDVSSLKAKRDFSTDSQRLQTEFVHKLSTFQDGDSPIGTCRRASCRLVGFDRSQGHIPACSDSPRFIQIPAVGSFANGSLSLPGSTIRTEYSATSIHPFSGVESQFGEVISDPQSEFRVSCSSLSLRPRDSPPSRSSAGQAAPRFDCSHRTDTHHSERIAVLPGSDQFSRAVSQEDYTCTPFSTG